jgi:hypothetical protein
MSLVLASGPLMVRVLLLLGLILLGGLLARLVRRLLYPPLQPPITIVPSSVLDAARQRFNATPNPNADDGRVKPPATASMKKTG